MEEILPTIRKTGSLGCRSGGTYMTDDALMKALTDPDFIIQMATQFKQIKEVGISKRSVNDHH